MIEVIHKSNGWWVLTDGGCKGPFFSFRRAYEAAKRVAGWMREIH